MQSRAWELLTMEPGRQLRFSLTAASAELDGRGVRGPRSEPRLCT